MRAELDLVLRGTVSSEDFIAAIARQQDARPPLGQIAIEQRLLTPRQVREALLRQNEKPHLRFGEVAVALGMITDRDLAYLLLKQDEAERPLMDHLVELGCIDEQQANAARSDRCWRGESLRQSV